MATTYTLLRPDVFPAGTTVSVYPRSGGLPEPWRGKPPGLEVTSSVAASTSVDFSSLQNDTDYWAYAPTPDRYVAFHTTPATAQGGVGLSSFEIDLSVPGALVVAAGNAKRRVMTAPGAEITGAVATVGTPSSGAPIVVNILRDGLSVFSDLDDRISIPAGASESAIAIPDRGAYAQGNFLTVDVNQVGSTVAGADMTVTVIFAPIDFTPDPLEAASYFELATTLPALKAFWALDEPSGSTAADSFGSNEGTYFNTPTLAKPPMVVGGTSCVGFARASSENARFSDIGGLGGSGQATLVAWVKPASQPTSGQFFTIVSKAQTLESATWGMDYRNTGGVKQFATYCRTGDTSTENVTNMTLNTGTAYCVGFRWDGAELTTFVNGVPVGTPSALVGTLADTGAGITIAGYDALSPSDFWDGDIDDVAYWSQALSDAEMLALYNKGLTG